MSSQSLALVLGGSSGIGLAAARKLPARGRDVILVARDSRKLEGVRAALLRESPNAVEIFAADLSDVSQVDSLISRTQAETRAITELASATGVFFPKAFLDLTVNDFDTYHVLNRSTFLVAQSVALIKKAQWWRDRRSRIDV